MYFLKILTELEYSGVGRNKEQSACMLGHLVSNAPRLIRPYMEPILKVCVTSHWQLTLYVKKMQLWKNFGFLCCCEPFSVLTCTSLSNNSCGADLVFSWLWTAVFTYLEQSCTFTTVWGLLSCGFLCQQISAEAWQQISTGQTLLTKY